MEWYWFVIGFVVLVIILAVVDVRDTKKRLAKLNESLGAIEGFTVAQKFIDSSASRGVALDEGRGLLCIIAPSGNRIVRPDELMSVEVFEDGDSITKTSRLSQAGGAAVGGLLLGGVGAVIGGLSGSKKTEGVVNRIDVRISLDDTEKPFEDISFMSVKSKKDSLAYKQAMEEARRWHSIISVLIRRADKEAAPAATGTGVAQELTQLKALLDSGVLTQEEFEGQKRKILAG